MLHTSDARVKFTNDPRSSDAFNQPDPPNYKQEIISNLLHYQHCFLQKYRPNNKFIALLCYIISKHTVYTEML